MTKEERSVNIKKKVIGVVDTREFAKRELRKKIKSDFFCVGIMRIFALLQPLIPRKEELERKENENTSVCSSGRR